MNTKIKTIFSIIIIISIAIILFGISILIISNKEKPKYDVDTVNQDEKIYKEEVTKYIQNMKAIENYSLSIQVSNNFDKSYNKITKYQMDNKNQKFLDATNAIYYNLIENKMEYYKNGIILEEEYNGELSKIDIFNSNVFNKPYEVKKKNDQYTLTYNNEDTTVISFLKNFIHISNPTKLEIAIRTGKNYIDSININFGFVENNQQYQGNIQIIYSEINKTTITTADKLDQIAKLQQLHQKELRDSFTIKVNGKNHIIDVLYRFSLYEEDNEFITTAYITYDGKEIESYSYDIFLKINNVNTNIDIVLNYKIVDLKEKITANDFHIIKGENDLEYIGIYSYNQPPTGVDSELIVLNENGDEIITIEAAGSTCIENYLYDKVGFYWHVKINADSINFLACEDRYNLNTDDNARVITEYKLTLGEKLSFKLINKYNDGILAGGGGGHINDIVPEEDIKQDE